MKLKNLFSIGKKSVEVIDTPERLQAEILGDIASSSGQAVTTQTAMQLSTLFGCVRVLAESVGMLPCKLYSGDGRERSVARGHWLHQLLHVAPNSFMTPQDFFEFLVACLCLRGNFFARKVVVRGEVRELLPLNPAAVKVKMKDWTICFEVRCEDGKLETLTEKEIFHIRLFSLDGITGVNPIRYNREAIGLALGAQEQGNRWFSNGVTTTGVLKTEQRLTDDAFNRLRQDLKTRNVGTSNAANPLILEMGLDWRNLSVNAEDVQFLETRKFQRDEICAIYRVPPHMVANLERATFSNIEHQGLSFVSNTLVPYLTRIEQKIRTNLIPAVERSEYFAKFNVAALLRGDLKARYDSYSTGINWGILSPNDCRANEDLNPRDGGDIYLTPINMTTKPEAVSNEPKNDRDAA